MGVVVRSFSFWFATHYPVCNTRERKGEMAFARLVLRGELSATLKQVTDLKVPFRISTQTFHNSRQVLKESQKAVESNSYINRHVEYIPSIKQKNPMKLVVIAWVIGFPSAIAGFFLAKKQVDKNRLKQLKVRQRMKSAKLGEYDDGQYGLASK